MRFIPTIVAGALALTFVSASSASAVGTTINTTCAALAASTRTISFSDGELDISFTSGDIVSWTNHVNPGLVVTSVNGVYLTPFVSTGSYTLGATDTSFMILAHPNGPYTSQLPLMCPVFKLQAQDTRQSKRKNRLRDICRTAQARLLRYNLT